MVVIPSARVCVGHIPRTAGNSLAIAITATIPEAFRFSSEEEHLSYSEAVEKYPYLQTYRFVMVMRSPYDILQSYYRYCLMVTKDPSCVRSEKVRRYCQSLAKLPFGEFVCTVVSYRGTDSIVTPPGFWHRYAGSDEVTIYQYADEPWPRIGELLGVSLSMPRTNSIDRPDEPWDRESAELVARTCSLDIERYGYGNPWTAGPERARAAGAVMPR